MSDCESPSISFYKSKSKLFPSFRIGDAAKNAFATNPENTVFDAKRLIGRKVDDPEIKKDMKHWPFKIVEKHGRPHISVKYKHEMKEFVSPLPTRKRLNANEYATDS